MARRGGRGRGSAANLGARLLLAAGLAMLGYASTARTLAYAVRAADPGRAHALSPRDGRITALVARQALGSGTNTSERARAAALARAALWQDPMAVPAAATLGLAEQVGGDAAGGRRLMAYALRLSRRDLPAQLWAIEDAVGRGDVTAALANYDIALRTSRKAPELLFPVLSAAISNPEVRREAAGTLAARPIWAPAFVFYVAEGGPDPVATARLFRDLARVNYPVPGYEQAAVINALVVRNLTGEAWSYYASTHLGADRSRSRDPRFTADARNPSIFDWTPVDGDSASASIQPGRTGGSVDFTAPAAVGGMVLKQTQVLPPGRYRLTGGSSDIRQEADARPYWTLTCPDGRELGRVDVPSSTATGTFSGMFTVTADCLVQQLALVLRPSDAVGGTSGRINRAALVPSS